MNKQSNIICPFCNQKIPKKYKIEQRLRKKKKKFKLGKYYTHKEVIGVDFEKHKLRCKAYQDFISIK